MNKTIKDHVLPLVGKVEMKGFKPGAIGSVMSLSMKMIKHTKSKNTKKLKMYLAFCIQTWPKFNTCPIDTQIIKGAVDVIEAEVKNETSNS